MIAARLKLNITFLKEFRETNNGDLVGMLKEKAKAEILCCENGKVYTNQHQTYAIRNAEIVCV